MKDIYPWISFVVAVTFGTGGMLAFAGLAAYAHRTGRERWFVVGTTAVATLAGYTLWKTR